MGEKKCEVCGGEFTGVDWRRPNHCCVAYITDLRRRLGAMDDLVKEFAEYNEDSGWHNVAGELRQRLKSILSDTTGQKEGEE